MFALTTLWIVTKLESTATFENQHVCDWQYGQMIGINIFKIQQTMSCIFYRIETGYTFPTCVGAT